MAFLPGMRRELDACASARGTFAVLALDHRQNLSCELHPGRPPRPRTTRWLRSNARSSGPSRHATIWFGSAARQSGRLRGPQRRLRRRRLPLRRRPLLPQRPRAPLRPLACPAWPQFRNGPRHTGTNPSETVLSPTNVSSLRVAWTATPGQSNRSSPAVADGVVYIGSDDGKLHVFAAGCGVGGSTCSPLWTASTGGPVEASPAVADGVVYVGMFDDLENGYLLAFASGCGVSGSIPSDQHDCPIVSNFRRVAGFDGLRLSRWDRPRGPARG